MDFEQLLFLEIFELLHKFGSNLSFKSDGNSVNMVNSAHRLSYTAGDLLLGSRRMRGRPQLRAGVGKVPTLLLLASEPRYLACAVAVRLLSPPLFSRRRRRSSVELSPSI